MSYLLSAHGIEKLFNRWQKQQGKSVFRNFAFSRMGSCLYSDFEKTPTDRSKMQEIFENIFRITAGQCDGLLFSTANAYAFPYAKVIQEGNHLDAVEKLKEELSKADSLEEKVKLSEEIRKLRVRRMKDVE